ncbi:MAG: ABC transporter substrate-binding protein [Anaerolineales bacterium]|nr:ABC transporter substrate-binding protein [Anaerolineales bacterium]
MNSSRKFKTVLALFLLLPVATLASCSSTPTLQVGREAVTLTDGMGREVRFDEPARRIVSIAPSSTEILFAIGAGDLVVGRDDISDFPPEVSEVTSIGSTYGDLNTEAIVALEPDLVVAAMINSPEHVQAIENLGIMVFVLPNPDDFSDLYQILETAGKITAREEQAATLAQELQDRVEVVLNKLIDVEPVKVYYEVDGMDPTAPWTIGSGTFQDVLITMAGGENIIADLESYVQLNLEELIARDPEVMIFSQSPWVETTPESVVERAGWSEITAVARGEIHGIEANWLDRPGPRLVDALEAMAVILHPERFE